jgi:hypothetical protein
VEAAGLLVELSWIAEAEARRRVLEHWCSGARVWAPGDSLVIVWPEPRRMLVADASGALLVRRRRALSSVPLSDDELDALAPPPDAIVHARGGVVVVEPLGAELDPSIWIDVGAPGHEPSEPLTEPPTRAPALPDVVSEQKVEHALRAAVGERAAGATEAARALAASAQGGASHQADFGVSATGHLLRSLWTTLVALLATSVRSNRRALGSGAGASDPSTALAVHHEPPPSALEAWTASLWRALRHLASLALMRLRLARFVGRQHAEYLSKMLDLFEHGDLENALRYAIPLGGEGGPEGPMPFSPPRPRDTLALTAQQRSAWSLGVGTFYDHLRGRYRAAFEKLDAAGDVDRAAFVLAELLRESAQAVAYLEKHRRFALAAELAEARHLPHEYVVRLWFRAGQRRRAIALARRHGCFALAVERLERDDPEAAAALRLVWADACASAGDYVGAATVARGIPSAEPLVAGWIERALAVGGAAAATATLLKLEIDPTTFGDVRERMRALLSEPSVLAQPERQAFLTALSTCSASAAPTLARAAVRAVKAGRLAIASSLVDALVKKAADPSLGLHALRAPTIDRATLPPGDAEATPVALPSFRRTDGDGGGLAVYDAAVVAHGRLLVALGELGVRLVGLDGRTLARFDAPASALVVSARGDRALAVMPRDGAIEVARLDVVERRVQRCGLLDVSSFARSFDGATWYVGREGEILALDATTEDFPAAWHTAMPPGVHVAEIQWRERELVVVGAPVGGSPGAVVEVFELPGATLRHRRDVESAVGGLGAVEGEEGERHYRGIAVDRAIGPVLCRESPPLENARTDLVQGWWCVSGCGPDGHWVVRLGMCSETVAAETAQCVLEGRAGVRLGAPVTLVFSLRGRILAIHPADGALVGEVRLRV